MGCITMIRTLFLFPGLYHDGLYGEEENTKQVGRTHCWAATETRKKKKGVDHGVVGVLSYGIYGVCIDILACRGLSLVSSPLHAMKSQSQTQSSAAAKFGGVTD
ncbi:hypothetical protein Tco_0347378 [Tanacetum coccineum]